MRFEIRNPKFEIRNSFGPEAHQDEFSTFNRGVVGSTPTRPTRLIANFELRIANLGRIDGAVENSRFAIRDSKFDEAREAQKAERSIGNREVASSIPAAGSGGTTAAGPLTTVASHRSSVVFRGSIAQTVERRSHKSVAGGSIPPRATSIER